MTSRDHVIKCSSHFLGGSSLSYVNTLTNLVTIYCDSRDLMFKICLMTSCDHMFKGSCDFMGGSPPTVSYHLAVEI